MKQKLIILVHIFFFFSYSNVFAHEIGSSSNETSSLSIWVYVFSALFILSIIGYLYASYLKKQLKKGTAAKKQKEIRQIKQQINNNRRQALIISTIILVVSLIISLIWAFNQPNPRNIKNLDTGTKIEVETFESEGTQHISVNDPTPDYKTFPPTSGDHYPTAADYGFFTDPIPFPYLVHSLEHGDIVIYYKTTLSDEVKDHLEDLSKFVKRGSGVIVVPNDEIQGEVAATSWTKHMILPEFEEKKLGQFIHEYIYEGPEKLPPRH